jgi:chromate transporter
MHELILMCFEFFKTGLFAIGGGLATLPFLFDMSEKYPHWINSAQLADIIAVSESTPGPIGINMATFTGFKVYGFWGAFLATFSLVFPSFVIIIIVAKFLNKYSDSEVIKSAFAGIRPAVVGLIAAAGYSVFKMAVLSGPVSSVYNILPNIEIASAFIFLTVLIAVHIKPAKKLHPIFFIALAAVGGIIFKL